MMLFLVGVGVCASCSLAHAFTFHRYSKLQITNDKQGKLAQVDGLTVDAGHLWLAGAGPPPVENRIDEFDISTGALEKGLPPEKELPPPPEFNITTPDGAIAVGHATGEQELYVGGSKSGGESEVAVLGENGVWTMWTGLSSRSSGINGIAIDETSGLASDWAKGDVYVSSGEQHVDVFAPEKEGQKKLITQINGTCPNPGEQLSTCSIESFAAVGHVAVDDSSGDVYVVDNSKNSQFVVNIFEPVSLNDYRFIGRITGTPSGSLPEVEPTLAVDGDHGEHTYEGNVYYAPNGQANTVYEFSRDGAFMGEFSGDEVEPAKHFEEEESLAVDPATHDVYVGEVSKSSTHDGVVDEFGPNVTIPDVETGPPSNLKLENALWGIGINGAVNPDEAGEATCSFVWGSSPAFGSSRPCTSTVPNGSSPTPVQAGLSGLLPDETYYYRLQAENKNGKNSGGALQDQTFITPGPGLRSESVSNVTSSGVVFDATIAPHDAPTAAYDLQQVTKSPTTFYFQYSTTNTQACSVTPSSCTSIPVAPASVGSGQANVNVERHVQGLQPGTEYHYRVVAANEALPEAHPGVIDEFYSSDRTFTTQLSGPSREVPDGRVWELVSPVNKHGATIFPIGEVGLVESAADGSSFTYLTSAPTESGVQGYGGPVQVLSSRSGTGWVSRDIDTPNESPVALSSGVGYEYRFFSGDLASSVVEPFGQFSVPEFDHVYEASPPATERTPYVRHDSTCESAPMSCYEPLVLGCPAVGQTCSPGVEAGADVLAGTKFGGSIEALGDVNFVGATDDASHVVLESSVELASPGEQTSPVAPAGGLYEWSSTSLPQERLRLVSVLPAGEGGGAASSASFQAISNDGKRVFFVARGAGGGEHLYMHDSERDETIRLDTTEGPHVPSFQSVSADGTQALFTDAVALTQDAGATTGAPDLYLCTVTVVEEAGKEKLKCELTDLTPAPSGHPGTGEGADVQGGVLGTSADGSYVYFVANGALTEGATAGAPNLYVAHLDNGVWATSFIATLSSDDAPDWANVRGGQTSRVSSNGEWLAFMSDRSLTGYDNRDAASGLPDEEVFLYDAPSGGLVCVSCNPTRGRPAGVEYGKLDIGLAGGNRVWPNGQWIAANIPGWTPYRLDTSLYQSRYLSDEGRLFFNSSDALVPQDVNANEDVYEYEPPKPEGCRESSPTFSPDSDGCVALISSGLAFGESAFLDASASGGDVFFLTAEKLVRQDVDTSLDVYDAHECTTQSPCSPPEPASPPECASASACRRAPLAQPPIYGAPSSQTFSGAGNVAVVSAPASTPAVKAPPVTWQQKLAKALKVCRRERSKRKRAACERQARKRYTPAKSSMVRARGKTSR